MEKILMIYTIGDDKRRIQFNRKLFSYKTSSHKGKYTFQTKGILTEYEKPLRSVIIFNKNKIDQVQKLCTKLKIQTKIYHISKTT